MNVHMLADWWGVEKALVEKQNGGLYALTWGVSEKGYKYITTGIIESYNPDSHLEIGKYTYFNPERNIFGPMKLSIQAKQSDSMIELTINQSGYGSGENWDWYHQSVSEAWPTMAKKLKDYLEDGFN